MPAKGFQLIAIEAKRHRKSAPQKQVRIDHNTTILSDKIAEAVHNRALAQGSFEVLNIAKKMNLPPPFKVEIPQIKIGKKGTKDSKGNSPEIA